MLTLVMLKKMLVAASKAIQDNKIFLCELDSVAGDGDHGIAMSRIADAMEKYSAADDSEEIKELLDDLSMAFMSVNGGSSGPLWGTIFGGFAEGVKEGITELDAEGIHKMLQRAYEDFKDVSKAAIGDKTMVDALYPALEVGMKTFGDTKIIFTAMAKAAEEGAEATVNMTAHFGRAKNLGERSLGSKDPGAVSTAIFFRAMADAI